MSNHPDLETLARGPRESQVALAERLAELRSQEATIIDCIKYVYWNQACSLAEAKEIVVNSAAWFDRKNEFLQHQQDMFEEFLESSIDQIETMQQTITPDGTKWVVQMKTVSKSSQTSAEPEVAEDGSRGNDC